MYLIIKIHILYSIQMCFIYFFLFSIFLSKLTTFVCFTKQNETCTLDLNTSSIKLHVDFIEHFSDRDYVGLFEIWFQFFLTLIHFCNIHVKSCLSKWQLLRFISICQNFICFTADIPTQHSRLVWQRIKKNLLFWINLIKVIFY